jgi:phenylpyruvate tautomerase PptA (4-oxalocrotonate tautomerase family)
MPVVDVEIVTANEPDAAPPSAAALASALGRVFGSPPGRTWVRLRSLAASDYAENDAPIADRDLPVFVTVLHAHLPRGAELAGEVTAITDTVAGVLRIAPARVLVQYAPAAAGRQSFGGRLVE